MHRIGGLVGRHLIMTVIRMTEASFAGYQIAVQPCGNNTLTTLGFIRRGAILIIRRPRNIKTIRNIRRQRHCEADGSTTRSRFCYSIIGNINRATCGRCRSTTEFKGNGLVAELARLRSRRQRQRVGYNSLSDANTAGDFILKPRNHDFFNRWEVGVCLQVSVGGCCGKRFNRCTLFFGSKAEGSEIYLRGVDHHVVDLHLFIRCGCHCHRTKS